MTRRSKRDLRSAIVKVRNFQTLGAVLSGLGVDAATILRRAALPHDLLSNPEATLRREELDRLLTLCAQQTGRDDIGFRVGELGGAAVIGLAGMVSLNCDTVREAWETVAVGLKTTDTLGLVTFSAMGEGACIAYELFERNFESAAQIEDCAIAVIVNAMRELRGATWRPSAVALPRSAPRDPKRYQRFFRCPVSFEAVSARVTFPADELDKPVLNSSRLHKAILSPLLEKALADAQADLVFEARATLRTIVANGAAPTFDAFCGAMRIGRDKLKRGLRESGVTFSGLVEEIKLEVAQTLLRSGKPIGEVAVLVGYAETSSFTRAFTRKMGASPSRWRSNAPDRRRLAPVP